MAGVVLLVSNTVGVLGAIADLGPAQDGARTFSLVNPAGAQGDQVVILGGNAADMSDAFLVGQLNTTNALAGGADGQNAALSSSLVFRYARTLRKAVSSSPTVVCECGVAEPSGSTPGAPDLINGGQAGPTVYGTTDATNASGISNNVTQFLMQPTGNSVWGSNVGAASTQVRSGTGGIGIGTTPVAGRVSVDAPGAEVDLAATAGTLKVGGTGMTGTQSYFIGAGGKVQIGSATALYSGTADSINVLAGGDGPIAIACRAAGAGSLSLAGGTGGADLDAFGAVGIADVNATNLVAGNQTGGMTTSLLGGTGGVAIGVPIGANAGVQITGGTGTSAWNIGAAGTLNLSANATDHTTVVGSITGASPSSLRAGTGALTLRRNGVTWTWPSADATNTAGQALVSNAAGTLSFGSSTQKGNVSLVNGVSAAISANISATSRIVAFIKTMTPGAGSLTVQYGALSGDRSNGTPGSFKLTALLAAGTINNVDTSNLDWIVLDN